VPLDALALALASAVVHALWNLLTARAGDSQVAIGVALAAGGVAFAPVAALTWDVGAEALPYAAASVVLELAYLALLATGYQRAPMSVVYPVARGGAPVIVLVVSALALGAAPPAAAAVGVLAVAAGVLLVRGEADEARDGGAARRGTRLGLVVAACIAGYTLVDDAALEHASPVPYLELVLVPTALLYLAGAAVLRGPAALRAELRPSTGLAGLGMFGAYALALAALARADAAPVAAVRESSVVMATGLAAIVLRERVDRRRWAGAVLVVAGIAAIALAR
jgi:multidrug transporter EmrE-like cation transporter